MITPEQLEELEEALVHLADPVASFIINDVVRRIVEAGQLTRTAEYQLKQAIWLKKSKEGIKALLDKKNATEDVATAFKKALDTITAQTQIEDLKDDEALQNILTAATKLAEKDFTNITQTLGLVDPYGNALPYQKAYRAYTDYAFKKVATGAQSYQEACYSAAENLMKYGVRVIDYESGTHTSVEAAIRRNIFGGLGLMVEQIQEQIHDQVNATGWELSAHEACAIDHEPYQGRQYTNAQYLALNGTATSPGILKRRIGTLNCKHIAFPILYGVTKPIYSQQDLAEMKARNHEGVTYEGKHYTMYEATQVQRTLERAIRNQRKRIVVLERLPGQEKALQTARGRYTTLSQRYREFSQAAGLRLQEARTVVPGFGPAQERAAIKR